jgi:predicted PurR-regulated permease PerM
MIDQAAINAADAALRAGLLINGGAAVSVLAFIGSLATKDLIAVSQLSRVASSLVVFAYGVAGAVVGLGLSYVTHFFEAMSGASLERIGDFPFTKPTKASKRNLWFRGCAHVLAVIAFFVCIGCFIFGMISVRDAIEHLAH